MKTKIPPRSPFSLIQEDLWPSEWKILISCMMLNCTTRRQVEKILPAFFKRWPTPESLSSANVGEVSSMISSLGFQNRRAEALVKMTKAYLKKDWKHAQELPGIGQYASAAWQIFVLGTLPDNCPKDHALVLYYKWIKEKEAAGLPLSIL